ncbi:MAG: superinfection immunity protein [Candidatus Omnitrophota bacterium]
MFLTEIFIIPLAIVLGVVSLSIIFLPTIIAAIRKHRQFIPILILNIFLWWTFIAWAIALAWAFLQDEQNEIITIRKTPPEQPTAAAQDNAQTS